MIRESFELSSFPSITTAIITYFTICYFSMLEPLTHYKAKNKESKYIQSKCARAHTTPPPPHPSAPHPRTHTHARTHTHPPTRARAHTHTHTHTSARTHARTHTHPPTNPSTNTSVLKVARFFHLTVSPSGTDP